MTVKMQSLLIWSIFIENYYYVPVIVLVSEYNGELNRHNHYPSEGFI